MTSARGILTLLSQTVSEEELTLAHETLESGYPLLAVFCGVAAARQTDSSISENIRQLIINEFSWPQDELAEIVDQLNHVRLEAA